MERLKIAAQFAAYTWYLRNTAAKPATTEDALRFARENWAAFVPEASAGLGKLLLAMTKRGSRGATAGGS
jgi:hypothetical protein